MFQIVFYQDIAKVILPHPKIKIFFSTISYGICPQVTVWTLRMLCRILSNQTKASFVEVKERKLSDKLNIFQVNSKLSDISLSKVLG